jgi:hypothetical protein
MHVVKDLDGTNIARAQADADTCLLTIVAPGGFSNQTYYPPESLSITTLEGVSALRQLCEELIEAHMEAAQAGG